MFCRDAWNIGVVSIQVNKFSISCYTKIIVYQTGQYNARYMYQRAYAFDDFIYFYYVICQFTNQAYYQK